MSPGPARRTHTVALILTSLLLSTALAGCTTTPAGPTGAWASDVQAHGRVGLEARLDATAGASGGTLTGHGEASIDTPLTLLPAAGGFDRPATIYFDATLPAIGSGVLLLEGARIQVTNGAFHKVPIRSIDAERNLSVILERTFGEHPDMSAIPDGYANESSEYLTADHIVVDIQDWQVTGHDRAIWFSGGSAEELTGPFTFDATRMHWQSGSRLEAAALQGSFARFAWASDDPSGTLTADTLGTMDAPLGVFGQDAALRLAGRDIDSTRPFRLTQAVTDDGFLLDAAVQLEPEHDEVVVTRGEDSWARVFYRERSYLGAAVFDDVTVTGPGSDLIKIPLDRPPLHVEALWDTLGDHPWFAQPFAAIAFVAISPALLLVDAIEGIACAFTTCPKDHPYPVWMEPGEVGGFYVQVSGDAPEGSYPVTVTIQGANHDPVAFDLTVTVRNAEA